MYTIPKFQYHLFLLIQLGTIIIYMMSIHVAVGHLHHV
jgi:hypothetical protein